MPPPPRAALEAPLRLVRDRPVGGNKHPSMLQHRFISASKLVQETASDLIAAILADEEDKGEPHWGEQGNALAAVNLRNVKCQEAELVLRVPGTDWSLSGHPDGIEYAEAWGREWPWPDLLGANALTPTTYYGSVFENKAPLHDPGEDPYLVEMAYRQGLLYLAMANTGPSVVGRARWLNDDRPPWHLPALRRAGQVIVCLTPYDSAKREVVFPVDDEVAIRHLNRCLEKAGVIVRGVAAKDPGVGVKEWDAVKEKGLGEFDLRGKTVEVTEPEVERIVRARADAMARAKLAQEEADALGASLKQFMGANGHERLKVAGQTLGLVRDAGGWRHYHQAPSVRFQTWGKVAPAPVQDASGKPLVEVRA